MIQTETPMEQETEYDRLFTALVRRHEKIIFSVCYFYATKDVSFEDLRQEALISIFKGYKDFKGVSSESTWIYKVCINTCMVALRKFRKNAVIMPLNNFPELDLADDEDDEWKQKLEWLHAAISRLKPMDKALILMWLDDVPYEDIATNMGIPRNTVASRLHRIKEKLSSKTSETFAD